MNFGNLSFLAPALLTAFLALPILWWLLRLTPPSPKRIPFPAIRLLFGLIPHEETPHRTPWWLILLRVVIAALIIAALSHPVWNAGAGLARKGPLLLLVDNGWASAPHWREANLTAESFIDQAAREGREVLLVPTAPALGQTGLTPPDSLAPIQAKAMLANLAPQPWPGRRDLVQAMLDQMGATKSLPEDLNTVWLSDGVGVPGDSDTGLAASLEKLGALRIVGPRDLPVILRPAKIDAAGLKLKVERPMVGAAQELGLRILDREGRTISLGSARFAASQNVVEAAVPLPLELRSRVGAVALQPPAGAETGQAGGIVLLDDTAGSKPIGVITDNATAARQPLLGELYYVERALQPLNELRVGNVSTLVKQPLSVMVLPDGSNISDGERAALTGWIEEGGTLIRFAGDRLALAADDNLLPVRLRQGDRVLGGALSWSKPASLAPFPAASPFVGLDIPSDVVVNRQVLAQPDIDLGSRTWARLSDGTPLVTGAKRGEGYVVLFHVSANTAWSNLALSGLYVEMLNRLLMLASGIPSTAQDKATPLPPSLLLDGYGRLEPAPTSITPISPDDLKGQISGPQHPAGLYGPAQGRRALNLSATLPAVKPLGLPLDPLTPSTAIDWKPWLLLLAALLLAADIVIGLLMRGLLGHRHRAAVGTGAAALLLMAGIGVFDAQVARAQEGDSAPAAVQPMTDQEIIAAADSTHLAYVRTGIPNVDATSRAGLYGLTTKLLERTSADMGNPVGIDLDVDTLDFYPVLYWPMAGSSGTLSDRAITEINRYLAGGGMILFDTADQNVVGITGGLGPGAMRLQELTGGLEVPPLAPVGPDHVLTRSFYLLKDFPGRWVGGTLWIESSQNRVNDGVASVIVGSNDYAAAWALDDYGQPLFPVTPGGEKQREYAYRFGINLVMYALTGKYKEDQVHVPAILERLGQ
jgi:hypothetical protein